MQPDDVPANDDLRTLEFGLAAYQLRQMLLLVLLVGGSIWFLWPASSWAIDRQVSKVVSIVLRGCLALAILGTGLIAADQCRQGARAWREPWKSRHLLLPLEASLAASYLLFVAWADLLPPLLLQLPIPPQQMQTLALVLNFARLAPLVVYLVAHLASLCFVGRLAQLIETRTPLIDAAKSVRAQIGFRSGFISRAYARGIRGCDALPRSWTSHLFGRCLFFSVSRRVRRARLLAKHLRVSVGDSGLETTASTRERLRPRRADPFACRAVAACRPTDVKGPGRFEGLGHRQAGKPAPRAASPH